MTTETALPAATQAVASTSPEASTETKALNAAIDAEDGANADGGGEKRAAEAEPPPKKEKTPEEREIARLRRRVDTLTRRVYESKANSEKLTRGRIDDDNRASQSDNETLSLSRKDLQELIDKEAKRLAPTIKQQETEIEHRRAVVQKLAKDWGSERFDTLASDLDDAFDGLADGNGRPKPAADAIFEADDPASLIEYLADPEHADEAEAIARMSAVQAGRAIAKLEATIASKKAKDKPQASRAAAPIEEIRGQGGGASKPLADLSDKEFAKRRREQIANRR